MTSVCGAKWKSSKLKGGETHPQVKTDVPFPSGTPPTTVLHVGADAHLLKPPSNLELSFLFVQKEESEIQVSQINISPFIVTSD